jgi:hypothetical protein
MTLTRVFFFSALKNQISTGKTPANNEVFGLISAARNVEKAIVLSLVMNAAIVLGSCGTGLPHSGDVVASVSPAQVSVPVGETVSLVGNATGFTNAEQVAVDWWVQEAKDSGGDTCAYLKPPPLSACEFGYVIFGPVAKFPSSASYHAPQTAGTYHVTFEATQFSYGAFEHVTKSASATITVTPAADASARN